MITLLTLYIYLYLADLWQESVNKLSSKIAKGGAKFVKNIDAKVDFPGEKRVKANLAKRAKTKAGTVAPSPA